MRPMHACELRTMESWFYNLRECFEAPYCLNKNQQGQKKEKRRRKKEEEKKPEKYVFDSAWVLRTKELYFLYLRFFSSLIYSVEAAQLSLRDLTGINHSVLMHPVSVNFCFTCTRQTPKCGLNCLSSPVLSLALFNDDKSEGVNWYTRRIGKNDGSLSVKHFLHPG